MDTDSVGTGAVVGLLDEHRRQVVGYGHQTGWQSGWVNVMWAKLFGRGPAQREHDAFLSPGPNLSGNTVLNIASITKVFTRLLLLDMVQRGDMRLDDPVQKYLPASVKMPMRGGRQITLLHLATHTSGLPRDRSGGCTPEDLYRFLSSYKLARDPGAEYEYSNLGACLLGQVIELKAGKPYRELLAERICRPLGMRHTCVDPQALACRVPPGAGRVLSTANDLLTFAAVCLGLAPGPSGLTPLMQHQYATHGGGFTSYLVLDPIRRRAVVSLGCSENGNYGVARMILNHLILNRSPRPLGATNLNPAACDRYAGQYLAGDNSVWIVRREGERLLLQKPCAPSYEVFPLSGTTFQNLLAGLSVTFVPETLARAGELSVQDLATGWNWQGVRLSARAPVRRVDPKLDANTVSDCTGQYRGSGGEVLILRCEGGQFSLQTRANNSADVDLEELIPGSESFFISPTGSMALTVLRDKGEKVAGLIRHVYDSHTRYAKFAAAPPAIAEADADRFLGVWEATVVTEDRTRIRLGLKVTKVKGLLPGGHRHPRQRHQAVPGQGAGSWKQIIPLPRDLLGTRSGDVHRRFE